MRWIALAIAGLVFLTSGYSNSGEMVRYFAEWQWWLTMWIHLPLGIVVLLFVTAGLSVAGAAGGDKVGHMGLGALLGGLSGFTISSIMVSISVIMGLLEAHLLFTAFKDSTSIHQFDQNYMIMYVVVLLLNIVRSTLLSLNNRNSRQEPK